MNEATAPGIDPKVEPDLTIEPGKDDRKLELWLEGKIIKELLPAYDQQSSALNTTENALALNLAVLKACIVGKGRGGKWEEYVKAKQFPVTLRTLDRWIEKALKSDPLPAWVIAKLSGNKRKAGGSKKLKMSLPLEFDSETDRSILKDALEKLGKAKLTQVILDAIREEGL